MLAHGHTHNSTHGARQNSKKDNQLSNHRVEIGRFKLRKDEGRVGKEVGSVSTA